MFEKFADSATIDEFKSLPLVTMGESKEIRRINEEHVAIHLIPTIYSFTQNRAAYVEGSGVLRLKAAKIFNRVLREAGVNTAYEYVGDKYIIAKYIENPPPIEVIVKGFHSGTSKHRYYGMGSRYPVNVHREEYPTTTFGPDDGYPEAIVRFDWRNPMWHPEKVASARKEFPELPEKVYNWPDEIRRSVMMADEVLGESQAAWYINVEEAKKTSLRVNHALSSFLGDRDIVLYDLCLFITSDGLMSYGEISQDCGRFRHFDHGSLDKDVWRAGGSHQRVLEKWQLLLDCIS